MDSGQATVRNVRSKCRCSCVLQFTFRHAVSCVLHRPSSQVIHCTVLCFSIAFALCRAHLISNEHFSFSHPITGGRGTESNPCEGERSLDGWISPATVDGVPYLTHRPPASRQALTARPTHSRCGRIGPQTGGPRTEFAGNCSSYRRKTENVFRLLSIREE